MTEGAVVLLAIATAIASAAAWLTHVVVCIKASLWVFLLAGAICFPVGIVHGFGIWFGAF